MNLRKKKLLAGLFLGSSALTTPSIAVAAQTPAPEYVDMVDRNNVDLIAGLPRFGMEEGGIGSGPGAVRMLRIWAEGAGFVDNWSGGIYINTIGNASIAVIQLDGVTSRFFLNLTDGTWRSGKGDGSTLTSDSSGYYYYTARDGTLTKFDNTTANASATTCAGTTGQVCHVPISTTHPDGLKFTLTWDYSATDSTPRLRTVSSSAGYSFSIAYTTDDSASANWSQRATVTFGNSVSPPSPPPTISYSYPSSTVTNVTDPAGRTWVFTTDSNGNLVGITRPGSSSPNVSYSYGSDGTVNSSTRDGITNSYTRVIGTDGTTVTETMTDPLAKQTQVAFSSNVNRPNTYTDPLGNTTAETYDSSSRLTQITAPEGNYIKYTYDARSNAIETDNVAKDGVTTLTSLASFDSTCTNPVTCNEPNSTTDANGNVTAYTYDPTHGGVLTVTPPSPGTGVQPQTRFNYSQVTSATGDLVYMLTKVTTCPTGGTSCTTANEMNTTAAYNSNLLPTSITKGNSSGSLASTSNFTYDSHGNLVTVNGPLSGTPDTSKYRYDAADQLVGITSPDPDGSGTGQPMRAARITYRPDGQVSRQEFGTVVDQTDSSWTNFSPLQTIDVTFDSNSRPVTKKLSAAGTAFALTQIDYDVLGRFNCAAIRMNPAGSLPSNACTQTSGNADQITQLTYDAAGEVTDRQVGVGVTGQTATERHLTYNPNGTVASLTDANSNVTIYTYDGFDRLTRTAYPDTTHEDLAYDPNSNVTSKINRAGESIGLTYDVLNRVTLKDEPGTANDVSYAWDNLGRLTSASQSGSTLSFTYDALSDNLTQTGPKGTVTSTYDLAGRRTSIAYPPVSGVTNLTVTYNYLTTGEVSSIVDGATNLAAYTYDALGNRTNVSFGNGTSENYTLDNVSRLTTLSFAGLPSADNLTIGGSSSPITYNAATQMLAAKRADAAGADTYAWPNYIAVTRTNTVNNLNQVTQTNSSISGVASFGYDPKGNLIQSGATYYCYDADNRLAASAANSACTSPTAALGYDPFGRLQTVTAGSAATSFAYDGLNLLAEYNGSALQDRYVFGPNVDEPIVTYDANGNRSWLYSDERGSIVASASSTAGVLFTNTYDEFGAPPLDSSQHNLNNGRFQFTGQAWLPEIGLYYYKARLYSPTMGRFMQTDPIGYADNSNSYAYVHNDPVNSVDPLGLCEFGEVRVTTGGTDYAHGAGAIISRGYCARLPGFFDSEYGGGSGGGPFGDGPFGGSVFDAGSPSNGVQSQRQLQCPSHPILGALGKVWTSPNTALGLLAAGISYAAGKIEGTDPQFQIGNNAVQLINSPLNINNRGYTLGNVQVYGLNGGPERYQTSYTGQFINIGQHEEGHTVQAQELGVLYLPAEAIGSLFGNSNPLEVGADNFASGKSCSGF